MQKKSNRQSNKQRTEATRTALIAAARTLFVEKGYSETGTPEIVAAAEVTRGALYHHFSDKADLFRAVIQYEARAVATQIEQQTLHPDSAFDALMTGAEAYFSAMAVAGRVRLLLIDGPSVLGRAEMDRIDRDTGMDELQQGLAFAVSNGALPQDTPLKALAEILSAAFDRAALAIAENRPADDYQAAIRLILSRLLKES